MAEEGSNSRGSAGTHAWKIQVFEKQTFHALGNMFQTIPNFARVVLPLLASDGRWGTVSVKVHIRTFVS